jgi:uncharacterized protein YndB with AHSA1/START domain
MPRDTQVVEVSAEIAAPPAAVFGCLVESSRLSHWLGARAVIDPVVGGMIRIDFQHHGVVVEGEVVEVVPDERLVLTWGIASGPDAASMPIGSTRVEFHVVPNADLTRLTVRHSGLATQRLREDHVGGWTEYLGRLNQAAGTR